MIFHNRFVSHEELVEFLGAADIYVTPYLKQEQSTSGTLAYAVGCGKAVVSTPYRYARELLDDGRGILVPWRDSEAIGREIVGLLDDAAKRIELQQRAAAFGRSHELADRRAPLHGELRAGASRARGAPPRRATRQGRSRSVGPSCRRSTSRTSAS